MELRHLRYFVAVGEEQHYGRAAQRLRMAQPALSRQIQDLEEEIGFKLFERLPRGVKINAAGKLFMEEARRILEQVKATMRVVADLNFPLPFALIWRKRNVSPLLAQFVEDVRLMPEVKALAKH
jgi:DNA-binding transcriptional LysR family regulator